VVLATEIALLASAAGLFLAGFTSHQPLISRIGILIALAAVAFAALAIRARRSRARQTPDDRPA
jgi:hypothetical protein